MPRRDPAKAVQVLDLLTEFFDNGRRWIRGGFCDIFGNRCLVGAMTHLRAVNAISGDGTAYYLRVAQPERPEWRLPISAFNDCSNSYDEIQALIDRARALAQAELDAAPEWRPIRRAA
jgi:hypothetical protein